MKIICSRCQDSLEMHSNSVYRNKRNNKGVFICHKCKISNSEYKSKIKKILTERNKSVKHQKSMAQKKQEWWQSKKGDNRRNYMQSKKYKRKMSKSIKKKWEDDQYREVISQHSKQKCSNLEFIEMLKDSSKTAWEDSAYRNKVIDNIDKEKISKNSKENWENLEYRKRIIDAISERSKDPKYLENLSEKSRKRWEDPKYKSNILSKCAKTREETLSTVNTVQKRFNQMLDSWNIEYVPEKAIGGHCENSSYYNFDVFIEPDLLIEVQGDYYHLSVKKNVIRDKAKRTYIENNTNYRLKYIWEHELSSPELVKNLVESWIGKLKTIKLNKKELKLVTIDHKTASNFLGLYHYCGKNSRGGINYGLYNKETLIGVIVFSIPIRLESCGNTPFKETKEISRFCINPIYQVKNLASWFITRAIKRLKREIDVTKIITFADSTYNHRGTIYKACGFLLERIVDPDYWYEKDGVTIHKRSIWTHAKRNNMKESEFVKKFNLRKIYGFEKYKFFKKLG